MAKSHNKEGVNQFSKEMMHVELVDLDNEYKLLRKKAEYLREKLYKENQNERNQQIQIRKLKEQIRHAQAKEQEIVEHGKKMFKIDFGDPVKQMRQEQQKELHLQKDKILKKIVILEDAKASNDKHFNQHHRSNMRKMQQLNEIKKEMLEQLRAQDLLYEEKQQQLKFFMQQKEARETLIRRRK